jgi:hypothetical protein
MDPTRVDLKHRLTPLHIAAYKGHVGVCTYLAKEMSGPGKRGVNVWWGQRNNGKRPLWRKSFGVTGSNSRLTKDALKNQELDNNDGANQNEDRPSKLPSAYAVTTATGATADSAVVPSPSNSTSSLADTWIDESGLKLPPYSPLAVAVKGHQPMVCKVLIDADGDPDVEDGTGKKPYDRVSCKYS